jgi:predicted nucleic acid-binding protein
MSVVVDSSVAIKWFLNEPGSEESRALLVNGGALLAPDFLLAEVANGLRRQERRGTISASNVDDAVGELADVFAELSSTASLIQPALQLSQQLDHSVYDCLFLAMRNLRGAPLVTADAAFVAKVAGTQYAQNVVLLADWKP